MSGKDRAVTIGRGCDGVRARAMARKNASVANASLTRPYFGVGEHLLLFLLKFGKNLTSDRLYTLVIRHT